MPRELRLPAVIENIAQNLPTKFPFEDQLSNTLNNLGRRISESPPSRVIERIQSSIPIIPEIKLSTPFGRIEAPEISMPYMKPISIDAKKREALKAAIAIDISSLVGWIPVIGDVVADIVEDTFFAKLRTMLSPKEMTSYVKFDKLGPSTLALLRTYAKGK